MGLLGEGVMADKRIAVLAGQLEEPYQQSFIRGIKKQAFANGYDVCIFSMFIKYQNNKERETGDSNIYNLVNCDMFDAVIIMSDTIQTPGVEAAVEERIHNSFKGPVLCVDTDSKYFYSFWTDGYQQVYATMSHLIEKHGYKDIAFLTGRRSHVHSQRRLEAYKDAMDDYHLKIDDDRIFYGDFWYTSGTGCAEELLRDRENLPEAIVCANDCMAIGLAEEMERHGVKIPDEIAVVGYGTSEEGQNSPVSLTSSYIPAEYYGEYSVDAVLKMIKGEEIHDPSPEAELYIGESCGCKQELLISSNSKRKNWMSNDSEDGFYSMHNFMAEDMLLASSLDEFFRTVYENIFFLRGAKRVEICLNEQWLNDDAMLKMGFPEVGYSQDMINILSYVMEDATNSKVSTDNTFESENMLPYINIDNTPKAFYFSPLYFENKSFGYAMISYGSELNDFEEVNRLWLTSISRGLEAYRRLSILDTVRRKQDVIKSQKFPANIERVGKKAGLSEDEIREMQEVEKILNENLLKYHFQPIVNTVDGEIYSYEALMRSNSQWTVPPLQIIKHADKLGRLCDVEKATFINILDIVDNNPDKFEGKKVFINSIPGAKLEYKDFVKVEDMLKKNSDRVIVELTEQAEMDDEELDGVKRQYSRLGIGLAVDDYGTGYSNISNLLRYMPNIVKIDRSLISEIQDSSQKQHFVREVIDFCHANDIMALAEGVETSQELRTVIRLGADLIQGYYTARPSEQIVDSIDSNIKMEIARYHREREDGSDELTYFAGRINRISLNTLIKEKKTCIVIGSANSTFRDITIVGTPNTDTGIHIEILEGYDGRITLENVNLSNIKTRPCIEMAENCDVTIKLDGENSFKGGGIRVPESSALTMEGDGNLRILLSGADTFAIGNSSDKACGDIEFYQDGEIYIDSRGQTIIGIGSGLGGKIRVHKGKYVIVMSGDEGVGIGSFTGTQTLIIHDCDLAADTTFYKGVSIGNIETNADVDIFRSLVRLKGGGKRISMIGTVGGDIAHVKVHDLNLQLKVNADYSTGLGSLSGASRLKLNTAGFSYTGMGREALVYGGFNEDIEIDIYNVEIGIDLKSDRGITTNAPPEKISEKFRSSNIIINGNKID